MLDLSSTGTAAKLDKPGIIRVPKDIVSPPNRWKICIYIYRDGGQVNSSVEATNPTNMI